MTCARCGSAEVTAGRHTISGLIDGRREEKRERFCASCFAAMRAEDAVGAELARLNAGESFVSGEAFDVMRNTMRIMLATANTSELALLAEAFTDSAAFHSATLPNDIQEFVHQYWTRR